MSTEPVLDKDSIARGQRARWIFRQNLDDKQPRAIGRLSDLGCEALHLLDRPHGSGRGKAASRRDCREIDAAPGVAGLHAGLAKMLVVDHDDVEIARARDADGGDAAEAHQLLAIPGQSEDALSRLGLRKAKPD